jgi:hypothetical protein
MGRVRSSLGLCRLQRTLLEIFQKLAARQHATNGQKHQEPMANQRCRNLREVLVDYADRGSGGICGAEIQTDIFDYIDRRHVFRQNDIVSKGWGNWITGLPTWSWPIIAWVAESKMVSVTDDTVVPLKTWRRRGTGTHLMS